MYISNDKITFVKKKQPFLTMQLWVSLVIYLDYLCEVITIIENGVQRRFFYIIKFALIFSEVKTINKNYIVNEDIRDKEIRAIGADGSQLGILQTKEVLKMAEEAELDLVMISPNAKPPVCKIMDLGKFIYEQSKKEKEAKKKQKVVSIKEVRVSLTIEEHDIEIKAKNARKFLLDGDKVKITVRFRGREMELSHLGAKILENFANKLADVGNIEKPIKKEGRNMTVVIGPKKA